MLEKIIPLFVGGMIAIISILVLRFWKKIQVTSIGGLGLLLIFLPQAQGLYIHRGAAFTIYYLILSFIGVILLAIDVSRKKQS